MSHDHEHDHEDGMRHLDAMDLRVRALETVLTQKGYIDPAALDVLVDTYQTKIGPRNGARVVAKAWADPAFAAWLQADATAAIASLGYTGRQGEHMVAVFNAPDTHHLVVCTLCSCYPWTVLGLPPTWYKSAPYRSRAVKDPRGVLADFGVQLPEATQLRVREGLMQLAGRERKCFVLTLPLFGPHEIQMIFTEAGELARIDLPDGYALLEPTIHGLQEGAH